MGLGSLILSSAISGAGSAFVECASNLAYDFFSNRDTKKKISTAEVRRYVDEYINEKYSMVEDIQFIKENLLKFIMEYANFMQSKSSTQYNITVYGNVNFNGTLPDIFSKGSIREYLELPESQKWNEIDLNIEKTEEVSFNSVDEKDDIDSLLIRAQNVGIEMKNIDRNNSKSIEELCRIVKMYEKAYDKRR